MPGLQGSEFQSQLLKSCYTKFWLFWIYRLLTKTRGVMPIQNFNEILWNMLWTEIRIPIYLQNKDMMLDNVGCFHTATNTLDNQWENSNGIEMN